MKAKSSLAKFSNQEKLIENLKEELVKREEILKEIRGKKIVQTILKEI